jgi:hypothetical protein
LHHCIFSSSSHGGGEDEEKEKDLQKKTYDK